MISIKIYKQGKDLLVGACDEKLLGKKFEDGKFQLEVNAGRLAEPLLKQGKQPKDDEDCHKAFLMLAHLSEIEDYVNGL